MTISDEQFIQWAVESGLKGWSQDFIALCRKVEADTLRRALRILDNSDGDMDFFRFKVEALIPPAVKDTDR